METSCLWYHRFMDTSPQTKDDMLLGKINNLELIQTSTVGELKGDIKVLANEIKHLNDTLVAQSKSYATKEEVKLEIQRIHERYNPLYKLFWGILSATIIELVVGAILVLAKTQ